ncbi:non-heme iron oxygenase ferredoxin subunit [Thioalbus denitrificans]|uniref:3-phenylpropionate/trans-cinnamate dioxygenase ferredoxin subunit n=1 Tax=Thioalbus denitrificans TaxID=547122 RepID=A0A369CBM5_9GAMM|nr:non-heme iron oxygenase ferredoxin subunit [Thioalbus denitrificans]RCX30608.1 3-phenylpropionate/trans-cinnamate dioxygenase ferredoxin subunit [Thioalbus denitrificans]
MSDWINVAPADDIAPGQYRTVNIDGAEIAVYNLDGGFYAIEDVCTHDGGCLAGGDLEGDEIVCPRHAAKFNIKTGEVTAPPAYEPVSTFPVQVTDGMVQVRDDRWD